MVQKITSASRTIKVNWRSSIRERPVPFLILNIKKYMKDACFLIGLFLQRLRYLALIKTLNPVMY